MKRRVYQNHHLDSTRWDAVALRPGDIVISTAYKAGTTFTQTIVGNLIFWGGERPEVLLSVSPWIEMRLNPIDEVVANIEGQQHRRFLKSHVGLDGIPYRDDVLYIYVGRDPRDVFMSLWNHYSGHQPDFISGLNALPARVGDPLPQCPGDPRTLWRDWITRGWFEWEDDGWPYWSLLHHARTWWEQRHRSNILCVHYSDLLSDLEPGVRRIAKFCGIERSEADLAAIADACRFENAKKDAARITGDMSASFKGGTETFFHKGTNGRWKDVLTEEDLALYRVAMDRLPPDLASWLETGGPAG